MSTNLDELPALAANRSTAARATCVRPESSGQQVSLHFFDQCEAAAYLGFTVQTFTSWLRRGLLPPVDPTTGGWTKAALDEAIERVQRDGVQNDNPRRRHSHFVKIYRCKHYWRDRQTDGGGWHFYFTPTWETLPGPWGSPQFMTALIAAERQWAAQQNQPTLSAVLPKEAPSTAQPELRSDRPTAAAQPSPASAADRPKSVTQNLTSTEPNETPQAPSPPLAPSPSGRLTRASRRRRAEITQAEIARVIRAAKQAGAAQVELRLSDSASILVRLDADNSVAPDEDIVL